MLQARSFFRSIRCRRHGKPTKQTSRRRLGCKIEEDSFRLSEAAIASVEPAPGAVPPAYQLPSVAYHLSPNHGYSPPSPLYSQEKASYGLAAGIHVGANDISSPQNGIPLPSFPAAIEDHLMKLLQYMITIYLAGKDIRDLSLQITKPLQIPLSHDDEHATCKASGLATAVQRAVEELVTRLRVLNENPIQIPQFLELAQFLPTANADAAASVNLGTFNDVPNHSITEPILKDYLDYKSSAHATQHFGLEDKSAGHACMKGAAEVPISKTATLKISQPAEASQEDSLYHNLDVKSTTQTIHPTKQQKPWVIDSVPKPPPIFIAGPFARKFADNGSALPITGSDNIEELRWRHLREVIRNSFQETAVSAAGQKSESVETGEPLGSLERSTHNLNLRRTETTTWDAAVPLPVKKEAIYTETVAIEDSGYIVTGKKGEENLREEISCFKEEEIETSALSRASRPDLVQQAHNTDTRLPPPGPLELETNNEPELKITASSPVLQQWPIEPKTKTPYDAKAKRSATVSDLSKPSNPAVALSRRSTRVKCTKIRSIESLDILAFRLKLEPKVPWKNVFQNKGDKTVDAIPLDVSDEDAPGSPDHNQQGPPSDVNYPTGSDCNGSSGEGSNNGNSEKRKRGSENGSSGGRRGGNNGDGSGGRGGAAGNGREGGNAEGQEEDDGNEDPNPPPPAKRLRKKNPRRPKNQNLACPYFKGDMDQYDECKDINRKDLTGIKEHLGRSHSEMKPMPTSIRKNKTWEGIFHKLHLNWKGPAPSSYYNDLEVYRHNARRIEKAQALEARVRTPDSVPHTSVQRTSGAPGPQVAPPPLNQRPIMPKLASEEVPHLSNDIYSTSPLAAEDINWQLWVDEILDPTSVVQPMASLDDLAFRFRETNAGSGLLNTGVGNSQTSVGHILQGEMAGPSKTPFEMPESHLEHISNVLFSEKSSPNTNFRHESWNSHQSQRNNEQQQMLGLEPGKSYGSNFLTNNMHLPSQVPVPTHSTYNNLWAAIGSDEFSYHHIGNTSDAQLQHPASKISPATSQLFAPYTNILATTSAPTTQSQGSTPNLLDNQQHSLVSVGSYRHQNQAVSPKFASYIAADPRYPQHQQGSRTDHDKRTQYSDLPLKETMSQQRYDVHAQVAPHPATPSSMQTPWADASSPQNSGPVNVSHYRNELKSSMSREIGGVGYTPPGNGPIEYPHVTNPPNQSPLSTNIPPISFTEVDVMTPAMSPPKSPCRFTLMVRGPSKGGKDIFRRFPFEVTDEIVTGFEPWIRETFQASFHWDEWELYCRQEKCVISSIEELVDMWDFIAGEKKEGETTNPHSLRLKRRA